MIAIDKIFDAAMKDSDMGNLLYHDFGVLLRDVESMPSEKHFATLVRCRVERRPGNLGMGGRKYMSFYIDMYGIVSQSPSAFIQNLRREMRISIKGAYWTDWLMKQWGYARRGPR